MLPKWSCHVCPYRERDDVPGAGIFRSKCTHFRLRFATSSYSHSNHRIIPDHGIASPAWCPIAEILKKFEKKDCPPGLQGLSSADMEWLSRRESSTAKRPPVTKELTLLDYEWLARRGVTFEKDEVPGLVFDDVCSSRERERPDPVVRRGPVDQKVAKTVATILFKAGMNITCVKNHVIYFEHDGEEMTLITRLQTSTKKP